MIYKMIIVAIGQIVWLNFAIQDKSDGMGNPPYLQGGSPIVRRSGRRNIRNVMDKQPNLLRDDAFALDG